MTARRVRGVGLAVAIVSLLLPGCRREAMHPDPAAVPATSGSRPVSLAIHVVRTTLAKMPVEVALPTGWRIVVSQSDEGEGLVAFGPDEDSRESATAFLDGSQVARVPVSPSKATAEAFARDACERSSACTVLGAETLPGGYLVSVRMPRAVAVESWRVGPEGRVVRCGFERSVLDTAADGATWLDEPEAVAVARREGEDICRSAKAVRANAP
jgi:hypothetical protein